MQESPDAPGQLCPASPRDARNAGHEHAPAIRVHLTDVPQRDADLAADEEPDIDAQPRLCSEIAGDEGAKRADAPFRPVDAEADAPAELLCQHR
jgi:hypothetical protein